MSSLFSIHLRRPSRWISFLIFFFLVFGLGAFLAPSLSLSTSTLLPLVPEGEQATEYPGVDPASLTDSHGEEGVEGATGILQAVRAIYLTVKPLLGVVLMFLLGGFSIALIISGGNEETYKTTSRHFLYLLAGIVFVVLADFLSGTFFLYREGASFASGDHLGETASAVNRQLEIILRFLRYVLSGIALYYVVKSGAAILYNADEETVDKQKSAFLYGFIGFVFVLSAEALVNVIFDIHSFPDLARPQVNVGGGIALLTNFTDLLLDAMISLFLFSLIAGGVLYAFSAGNEERGQRATKIIVGSLMGLVIAFASYTIVREFATPAGILPGGSQPKNFDLLESGARPNTPP